MTTLSIENLASVNMLQVFTAPQKVAANTLAIEWKRRSTKTNPVDEANRYRAIHVAEGAMLIGNDACQSKFQVLLQSTIHDMAAKMLAEELAETDKREVQAARYTVNGVLAYWAEEKKRQTIDAAQIVTWLKASKTFESLNANQQRAWLERLPKLASPAYRSVLGADPKQAAAVIMSRLHDDDLEHAVCVFLSERLTNIINAEDQNISEAF